MLTCGVANNAKGTILSHPHYGLGTAKMVQEHGIRERAKSLNVLCLFVFRLRPPSALYRFRHLVVFVYVRLSLVHVPPSPDIGLRQLGYPPARTILRDSIQYAITTLRT